MNENWIALFLCILRNISINDSVSYILSGRRSCHFNKEISSKVKRSKYHKRVYFPDYKCREVLSLREKGVTWRKISQIYKINLNTLKTKVNKYKQKKGLK